MLFVQRGAPLSGLACNNANQCVIEQTSKMYTTKVEHLRMPSHMYTVYVGTAYVYIHTCPLLEGRAEELVGVLEHRDVLEGVEGDLGYDMHTRAHAQESLYNIL